MSLLAVTRYGPTPYHVYSATISDPPVQAIDSTNLAVSFTLSVATNLVVRLTAWQDVSVGSMLWGLLESGSVVSGSCGVINRSNSDGALTTHTIYLTNVSSGSHTYVWGWSNANTMRLIIGDGVTQDAGAHIWAPAIMEVWEA